MKVSYFETGRYVSPPDLPREWPVPPGFYDPETGAEAYRGMVARVRFVTPSSYAGARPTKCDRRIAAARRRSLEENAGAMAPDPECERFS